MIIFSPGGIHYSACWGLRILFLFLLFYQSCSFLYIIAASVALCSRCTSRLNSFFVFDDSIVIIIKWSMHITKMQKFELKVVHNIPSLFRGIYCYSLLHIFLTQIDLHHSFWRLYTIIWLYHSLIGWQTTFESADTISCF